MIGIGRTIRIAPNRVGFPYHPSALGGGEYGLGRKRSPELGLFGIDTDKIILSVGLATGGAGAIILAKYLPEPLDTIAVVGGIGALGWSAINLLMGISESPIASDVKREKLNPPAQINQLEGLSGEILSPKNGDVEHFAYPFDDDYDVVFKVYNNNPQPLNVRVVFDVHENGQWKETRSKTVNVGGGSSIEDKLELEVKSYIYLSPNVEIFMSLETLGPGKKLVDKIGFTASVFWVP